MAKIVDIDPLAGFCFGVEKAIDLAEKYLDEGEEVFGLGHMVHNEAEIERLKNKGLETINISDFASITSGKVLLRAHGEPPSTFEIAGKHNLELIDATCPIVVKLQKKIRTAYLSLDKEKEQIVIFGKRDHPETIGLLGQTNNEAIVVSNPEHVSAIPADRKIYLYSQTTMDPDQFDRLVENIRKTHNLHEENRLEAHCTICGQMKKRKPGLKKFALAYETVIFLSGRDSSNGKMLFEYCKKHNENTFHIQNPSDIDPAWIAQSSSIGISGATSTPLWQLKKVEQYIRSLFDTGKDAVKT